MIQVISDHWSSVIRIIPRNAPFVLSFLFFKVKTQQYFVSSNYMFLGKKTLLEIWLNPRLNLTIFHGAGPRTITFNRKSKILWSSSWFSKSMSLSRHYIFFVFWESIFLELQYSQTSPQIANLCNRMGKGRRRQTLSDKPDNNFVCNNFLPIFTFL